MCGNGGRPKERQVSGIPFFDGRKISNRISLKVLSTFKDTCRRAWNVCGYFRKTLNSLVRYILVNQVGLGDLRCRKVEKLRETSLILSGTWLSGRGWVRYPRHSIKREERDTPANISAYYPLSHDLSEG